MPRIICTASDCIYNNEQCQCSAKTVHMTDGYWHTVYEGVKHFNICKDYSRDPKLNEVFEDFVRHVESRIE